MNSTCVPFPTKALTNLELKKYIHKGQQKNIKNPDYVHSCDVTPLTTAISTRNKNIIALTLQYGASVKTRADEKFDALGVETCHNDHLPRS